MTTASHLALASTELAGLLDLDDVWTSANGFQESGGDGSLDEGGGFEGSAADDEWDFGDGTDAVATGEEESWDTGCSDGGCCSEASGNWLDRRFLHVFCSAHFWFWLIFWCHFLQTFVGANMRPDLHMLPKAA
jgi:hypothetical protein